MTKILIIDDEFILRLTFRYALEEEGYEVQCAENGEDGIELCRTMEPDIVITDLLLPDMDGFTIIDLLRRRYPSLPIVAISAAANRVGREHSIRSGASRFLPKPVSVNALKHLVQEMTGDGAPPAE